VSGFTAQWLALREPFDRRARNPAVLDAVARAFAGQNAIAVADLACGAGSTLRAIAARLPVRQDWRLVDNDLGLLLRAEARSRALVTNVRTMPVDLARDLEAALDGPLDLVTTSALLDLVSGAWLDRLVHEIAARKLPFYAALTYDGRAAFDPPDPRDDEVIAALNRHQRRDKGFGPALGPDAARAAEEKFRSLGYEIAVGRSDWEFAPDDREIQFEMLSGWASAARETGIPLSEIKEWLAARRSAVNAGRAFMRVGHVDFFARSSTTR
jgi:hypothetical protein